MLPDFLPIAEEKKKKTQQKIEFLQGLEMLSERIIYREEETESF